MAAYLILANSRVLILRQVLPYMEEAKLLLTPLLPRLPWSSVPTAFAAKLY
jgi:hypothetical protein